MRKESNPQVTPGCLKGLSSFGGGWGRGLGCFELRSDPGLTEHLLSFGQAVMWTFTPSCPISGQVAAFFLGVRLGKNNDHLKIWHIPSCDPKPRLAPLLP